MRLVFTSYVKSPAYRDPAAWLKRIEAYTGILESLAHRHSVAGIERIDYEGECEQKKVHYYFTRLSRNVVYFPFRMHRLIKRMGPDIVFVNGFIFPLQIIQLRLSLGRRIKIIVLHRAEKPFTGVKRYLQKLADTCVDAYLFSSIDFRESWKQNINVSKMHEVMQASSVFELMPRERAKDITSVKGNSVFLWVGRLDANKDPMTVVSAFLRFLEQQPQAALYMIYQNNELEPALRELIGSNQHSQNIHLVGKVDHNQMQAWYNSTDFFISGSHYEGGGTALAEAMSCGCIPIVTNIPSFGGMTGQGKCGWLYEPGNAEELFGALSKAMQTDIEQERIKILNHFKQELSFDAIAAKIDKIINSF